MNIIATDRSSLESDIHIEHFPNGLTLLYEHMPWLRSVAFTLLTGSGTVYEPAGLEGLAGVSLEMVQRGAGQLSSREIVERLDFLGVERSSTVTTCHSIFSAAMLPQSLPESLAIYGEIVQRPHLREDDLEDARRVAQQEVRAIQDDVAMRSSIELKRFRYQEPYGRSAQGRLEGIERIELNDVVNFVQEHFSAAGAILAVAGNYNWEQLRHEVVSGFGTWQSRIQPEDPAVIIRSGSQHIVEESAQTYLALAFRSVPYHHPEYYLSRGLLSILGDGMSSRLFSEVREKRGLVYAISANHFTLRDTGSILCFAGSTAGRARETLDVTLATISSLGEGIDPSELVRMKNRMKMNLVLEPESGMSRSAQMASDWYYLGRVQSPREILSEVEHLTCDALIEHFQRHPPTAWTLVSIGEEQVELPYGI